MCRTRRIKCDETKPTCLQCQKSRRQCPGYKDDFDLVFRNETQATERRARRAVNNKRLTTQVTFASQQSQFANIKTDGDAELSSSQLAPNSDGDMMRALVPSTAMSIPLDVQAPCYFMSNFTLASQPTARGYFDFLLPLVKTEPSDSHFSLAFSAVAFASLANRPSARGSNLLQQASNQYTKALRAVNVALQTPSHQKTDQTLAAILMLGFFETISSERTTAMAWYSHIDGAVQLVKMRGKKQLRTKIGHSLFLCVRNQMTISCMTGSKAPPLGVDWWLTDATKDDRVGTFLPGLSLRIAELRAEINTALTTYPRTPEYFQEAVGFMKRAQAMENEYQEWEALLPDKLRPRTCAWVDHVSGGDISKAEVCPGKVDMFTDIWIANMWNAARVARLFISGVIVRCAAWICSPVDYRTTPEYATANRLCADLVTDIIASVPYHLGWRPGESMHSDEGTSLFGGADHFASPKAIGGFFCMWPLFSCTNTDYATDSQRQWAKGRLLYISEILGMNQAAVLANYGLRLPSMIIRRDAMSRLPPQAQAMAAAAYARYTSGSPQSFGSNNPSPHITTITIDKIAAATGSPSAYANPTYESPNAYQVQATGHVQNQGYALNPLQQREQMQRETWERERKALLKKASNAQGDSVERLLAKYLAV